MTNVSAGARGRAHRDVPSNLLAFELVSLGALARERRALLVLSWRPGICPLLSIGCKVFSASAAAWADVPRSHEHKNDAQLTDSELAELGDLAPTQLRLVPRAVDELWAAERRQD